MELGKLPSGRFKTLAKTGVKMTIFWKCWQILIKLSLGTKIHPRQLATKGIVQLVSKNTLWIQIGVSS